MHTTEKINMNHKKNILLSFIALLGSSALLSLAHATTPLNLAATNPGAESGDLTGWSTAQSNFPDDDYSSVNDSVQAHSGSHYFRLNPGVFPSAMSLVGQFPGFYEMKSDSIDLSALQGNIDTLSLFAFARTGNLTLTLENSAGDFYNYILTQSIGITLFDNGGNRINGLGYGSNGSSVWNEEGGNFSWWSQWEARKSDIASISIFLDTHLEKDFNPSTPDLNTINPNDITDAFYTWTGADGSDYSDADLSLFTGDALPVIGFDDVRLELTTVPLPGAVWLLSLALGGLSIVRCRH